MPELLTPLVLGALATGTPCVLPLYPGFLAYLTARTESRTSAPALGLLVLAGVLTMMLLLGLALSLLALATASVLRFLTPAADLVLILLGLALLSGRNPFLRLSQIELPAVRSPYLHAYAYGLLYGPITFPCTAPLALAVFAFSFSAGQFLEHLSFFLLFGLGLGLPLFALALVAHQRRRALAGLLARRQTWFNALAGVALLGVGIYDLWINWEFIALVWRRTV